MHIDTNISDLFFNTDISRAKIYDHKGHFMGYKEDVLKEEATDFLNTLDRLGVNVPTPDQLVQDFYNRI